MVLNSGSRYEVDGVGWLQVPTFRLGPAGATPAEPVGLRRSAEEQVAPLSIAAKQQSHGMSFWLPTYVCHLVSGVK